MICNIRIDDRLIHGQVATMWVPHLKANRAVIVDNKVAADEVRKSLLKMAAPEGCKVLIFNAETAAEKLINSKNPDTRILILCNGPQAIYEMMQKGLKVDEVTIGNMSHKNDSRSIRKTIFITEEEKECFIRMEDLGVRFISQMIPTEAEDESAMDDIRKA